MSTEDTPIVEPISDHAEAQRMTQRYLCSACWSHLNIYHRDGKMYALCPNCGTKTPGYNSKKWVERRKSESHAELLDARHNLRDALPNLSPRAKQTAEQILAEIGF